MNIQMVEELVRSRPDLEQTLLSAKTKAVEGLADLEKCRSHPLQPREV